MFLCAYILYVLCYTQQMERARHLKVIPLNFRAAHTKNDGSPCRFRMHIHYFSPTKYTHKNRHPQHQNQNQNHPPLKTLVQSFPRPAVAEMSCVTRNLTRRARNGKEKCDGNNSCRAVRSRERVSPQWVPGVTFPPNTIYTIYYIRDTVRDTV